MKATRRAGGASLEVGRSSDSPRLFTVIPAACHEGPDAKNGGAKRKTREKGKKNKIENSVLKGEKQVGHWKRADWGGKPVGHAELSAILADWDGTQISPSGGWSHATSASHQSQDAREDQIRCGQIKTKLNSTGGVERWRFGQTWVCQHRDHQVINAPIDPLPIGPHHLHRLVGQRAG